jgi:outer membrane protein assembly factor BamD
VKKNKKLQWLAATGLLCLAGAGCSWWGHGADRAQPTAAEYFAQARASLEKEDYVKAVSELKTFVRRFPENDLVDDAILDLAKAHYLNKEYPEATYELKRLTRDYAQSPLVEDAQYYQAMCWFKQSRSSQMDQAETNSAIDEFNNYLNDYPQGKYRDESTTHIRECRDKLGKKEYENARLYFRQKDYQSAIIYCREVIDNYPDTPWKEKALELLGQCEIRQKQEKAPATR